MRGVPWWVVTLATVVGVWWALRTGWWILPILPEIAGAVAVLGIEGTAAVLGIEGTAAVFVKEQEHEKRKRLRG